MKDDVGARRRLGADRLVEQVPLDQPHARAAIRFDRLRFKQRHGRLREAHDRLGTEVFYETQHETAPDEAGAAGDEEARMIVHCRRKMNTRGWSNRRKVSSARSSL